MKKTSYDIFLADDDQDDRELFEEVLEELNQQIKFKAFDNGVDLMNHLANVNNKGLPDYIFLDLNMPLMDGEECLHQIRSNSQTKNIPVIIYSTSIDLSKAERLRDHGANLYLKKPNSFNALRDAIIKCIKELENLKSTNPTNTSFIVQF